MIGVGPKPSAFDEEVGVRTVSRRRIERWSPDGQSVVFFEELRQLVPE